jgi:hypothetical protein
VGVAYNDSSGTNFYQPGEGQANLQIDAVNLQTGQVTSTQTWSSGGYELSLAAGQYRIIASLNNQVFQSTNVTVGNVNIEQDFVLSNPWQGGTRAAAIAAAQPVVSPPPVVAPQPVATPQTISLGVITPPATTNATTTNATSTPNPVLALMGSWSAWNAPVS